MRRSIRRLTYGHLGASLILVIWLCLFVGCQQSRQIKDRHQHQKESLRTDSNKVGLKDYYKDYFPIGVAVNTHNIRQAERALIVREFNSITPENDMKMGPIHPAQGVYNWEPADEIVRFARANHLKVRGHNLCWHEQTPGWIFRTTGGQLVSRDTLLARLKSHINTVVKRYAKDIYCWDVVNEAVADDTTKLLRDSKWTEIIGPSFIDSAFWFAHRADPGAALYYNDYNVVRPDKLKRVVTLVSGLIKRGVPISGVGIQAHWSIYEPSMIELENAIKAFSDLGLKVQFTELDISVFPWEKNKRKLQSSDQLTYKGEISKKQSIVYRNIFNVFRKYRDDIAGITFWNLSDKDTWLDHYPVEGRKNYPLLFDTTLHKKPAYQAVTDF